MTAGKSSSFDPTKAKDFVDRIENLNADILSEQGTYMAKVKSIKEDIGVIFDEAKTAGIPKKALRAVIKTRELQGKLEATRDDLEPEDQDSYDAVRHAIGDLAETPLGKAALARTEQGKKAVDELATAH